MAQQIEIDKEHIIISHRLHHHLTLYHGHFHLRIYIYHDSNSL